MSKKADFPWESTEVTGMGIVHIGNRSKDGRLRRFFSVTCSHCTNETEFGFIPTMAPPPIIKRFKNMGWKLDPKDVTCPTCLAIEKAARRGAPGIKFKDMTGSQQADLAAGYAEATQPIMCLTTDAARGKVGEATKLLEDVVFLPDKNRKSGQRPVVAEDYAAGIAAMEQRQARQPIPKKRQYVRRNTEYWANFPSPVRRIKVSQAPASAPIAQSNASPSIKTIIAIHNALSLAYDEESGRYSGGMSDTVLAAQIGFSPDIIRKVREETYGPMKEDPEFARLSSDIGAAVELITDLQRRMEMLRNSRR